MEWEWQMKRRSDLAGPTAYPGETPQAESDRDQLKGDYSVGIVDRPPEIFNWAMSGTHVSVSDDDHATQFDGMSWTDFERPFAYGQLELHFSWNARWIVTYTNMSIPLVEKRLKTYSKNQGWEWAGIEDSRGEPLESRKARAKVKVAALGGPYFHNTNAALRPGDIIEPTAKSGISQNWPDAAIYDPNSVYIWNRDVGIEPDSWGQRTYEVEPLGSVEPDPEGVNAGVDDAYMYEGSFITPRARVIREIGPDGWNQIFSKTASVPGIGEINPGLIDYRNNQWSGMETFDNPGDKQSETPFYGFQDEDASEDMPLDVPRTCSECGALALNYDDWRTHILREHLNPERKPPGEPQPVVDLDDVLPANFNNSVMDKTVQRQSRLLMQLTAAKPQIPYLPGPIPFIFDIEQDRIYVGHPGERHSDIQGRFTPGGLIEGLYDPKGNVQIRTDTDMPYTVRHMLQLWYALHPELAVRAVFLLSGQHRYRLATKAILERLPRLGRNGQRIVLDGKLYGWRDN